MTVMKKISDYFRGAMAEMKKVVWPTKEQTKEYSIIVIVLSLGMAIFFGVLDYIFNLLLQVII